MKQLSKGLAINMFIIGGVLLATDINRNADLLMRVIDTVILIIASWIYDYNGK